MSLAGTTTLPKCRRDLRSYRYEGVIITITAELDDSLSDEQVKFIAGTALVQVAEPLDLDGETELDGHLVKSASSTVVIERT